MFASLLAATVAAAAPGPATIAEWRSACAGKDGWSDPAPPVRIYGNTFYVGTCGITALLIAGPRGHILLDAATAQAAPFIAANIERLGMRLRDVRKIGFSHEHLDHVGGVAELQRRTGAALLSMPPAYVTMQTGTLDQRDPQFGSLQPSPRANVGIMLRDGHLVEQGPLRLTAIATPGHSPGGTSWQWRSCQNRRCVTMVYADSISAVSADGYRFSDHRPYVARLRNSIGRIARLRCDLLITPHPGASKLFERLEGQAPLIDPAACRAYAARGLAGLNERLAKEQQSN